MTLNDLRLAVFLMATCTLFTAAQAQTAPPTGCPLPKTMKAEQLFGQWAASFTNPPAGLPAKATLQLQRHAEFSESLAGTVSRDMGRAAPKAGGHGAKAALAGDLEEGTILLLDESSDGISISGTWNGEMVKDSCGKLFQGTWKDTSSSAPDNAPDVPFTLRKLP